MGSLNAYEVIKAIGKGSYGEVHLIQHKQEKKQYVVKKLILRKASRRERKAAELEAKLLSKLKHPNIISYKDSFESDDGFLYIVMGYAEGGDLYTELRHYRERNEFLTEVQVVRWFIQICMALQYLHQQHILHRDLKTQNIFLTKTKMIKSEQQMHQFFSYLVKMFQNLFMSYREITNACLAYHTTLEACEPEKVGDLGIARVLEGASDMATTLIGTPYYMSPELFSNKPYNYKSDVWALGCCVYEMATLRHAFNAKDMNSLVYKILKRKMPKMPDMYSDDLCDLIKNMLHQNADKRPSVNKILRNAFIKKHIQLFLDESSKSRRPTSGKAKRTRSEQSSRKTSVSSSRCSSRESNSSVFEHGPPQQHVADKESDLMGGQAVPPSDRTSFVVNKRDDRPAKSSSDSDVRAAGEPMKSPRAVNSPVPKLREERKPTPETRVEKADDGRARSAGSSGSDSGERQQTGRRLPDPLLGNRRSSPNDRDDSKRLESSSSSITSVSSTKTSSSARERRRARQQRERLSRQGPEIATDGVSNAAKKPRSPALVVEKVDEHPPTSYDVRKGSNGEEMNQFYTLLHTTLKLGDDKNESPPTTPTNPDEVEPGRQLSPVPELSESHLSTEKETVLQKTPDPFTKNTPQATEIDVRVPPQINQNVRAVTQATLASTSKLMKRIVMLRKDCIKGLGVPLLHRAYELLDENNEDELEKRLIDLLGEVRFNQWAGKIWQLKFCEESIFQHCGSITAYS